ncbi:MAG TPA: extracellular solute-binding protein, partial [Candidatus Paceibacterota bacterium]
MSLTQIITTAVFVIAIVFAVLVISGIIPLLGPGLGQKPAQIELWGTFPSRDMELVLNEIKSEAIKFFEINYVEKNPETFESELLNALASGKGPDAWFITQDAILKSKNRLHAIPFASLSERSFNDTFIDGANLFLEKTKERGETGTIAVPVLVDPIVLYVNKDLLSSSGIAKAPEYWDQFLTDIPKLTRKDERGNVTVSGAALGEFENVTNAKEIISMFILERGNPIVDPNTYEVTIRERGESLLDPGENSLGFFNEFSNPNKVSYSWNRSLPESQKAFSAGSLAFYFG